MIIEKVYSTKHFKRLLIIKETKSGLQGIVKMYSDVEKKWITTMKASFYYKDNDATPFRVKEYFGFSTY